MLTDIFYTEKQYTVIYADPPWRYKDRRCSGACEFYYNTMQIDDICALPVERIAAKDSVLFLWTTYPMLQEAMRVIKSWGFQYKSIAFQWVKLNKSGNGYFFGLGRWTRGNTEPCLIAVRGKPKRISAGVGQLIFAPLREHSRKPAVARKRIVDLLGDVPRIELFARTAVPGWDCWGDQAPQDEHPSNFKPDGVEAKDLARRFDMEGQQLTVDYYTTEAINGPNP